MLYPQTAFDQLREVLPRLPGENFGGKGELAVADDGPGILPHELPRVTARGFTGAHGRSAGGTGMGLYIVSELCKRLGIELAIFSEAGKGTRVSLKFPGIKD